MRTRRQGGFVIVFAILTIGLVATAVYLLSHSAQTMVMESNRMAVEARCRDLLASGKAWADHNAFGGAGLAGTGPGEVGQDKKLDVSATGWPGDSLTVVLAVAPDGKPQVKITATCIQGRRQATRELTYAPRRPAADSRPTAN